jgi:hypothetical protein
VVAVAIGDEWMGACRLWWDLTKSKKHGAHETVDMADNNNNIIIDEYTILDTTKYSTYCSNFLGVRYCIIRCFPWSNP